MQYKPRVPCPLRVETHPADGSKLASSVQFGGGHRGSLAVWIARVASDKASAKTSQWPVQFVDAAREADQAVTQQLVHHSPERGDECVYRQFVATIVQVETTAVELEARITTLRELLNFMSARRFERTP